MFLFTALITVFAPRVFAFEKAIFAGGCFWCMQPPFDRAPGVISTRVGYTGGEKANPTYEEVSGGTTGHAEAIEITFEPTQISYRELLSIFWHNTDPLTRMAQFCDHGDQYRTGIFYLDEKQKTAAIESKTGLEKSKKFKSPIITEIAKAGAFYPAEDYHQGYYKKNPIRYKFYRFNCGRDKRLKELWGKEAPDH
ncbi:MAG: peptide-methionine (S)-S-oxide reductase MsrA [Bdellovibrionota bacterium]